MNSYRWLICEIALLGLLVSRACNARGEPWAQLAAINLSSEQRTQLQGKQSAIFSKELRFPANQLLFSWNALRPKQGYFGFYMQVKDHASQRWSAWLKLAAWGSGVQRSFKDAPQSGPGFYHVRLQTARGHYVDACRIRVQAHDGASLTLLYRLALSAIDFGKFVSERGNGRYIDLSTIKVDGIPAISQMRLNHREANRICSPTSLSMVVAYINGHSESPESFADGVYDYGLGVYGSWPFNTAHAFARSAGKAYFSVTRLNSFTHLHYYLSRGLPVVVSVRGPMRTMPAGRTYEDGHLLVVVGWDNQRKQVLCHDPAFPEIGRVAHAYPANDFINAWECSQRLAYVVDPRD